MFLSPELKEFIHKHFSDNTEKLLLAAFRYPEIDIPFVVNQIVARRQIREKLPSWFSNENLIFPSRLSAEQCSSESTAIYKQRLLRGNSFCDLTGGLGIDTYYFSQKAREAIYVERFAEYCATAVHNFNILQAGNIRIVHADARDIAGTLSADTFYIDPARRAECNKRVFALPDCEPDITQLKPLLLERSQRIIVKISPMADLEETLRLLPETTEIHVLAVKNECKELLFVLEERDRHRPDNQVVIHAVNLHPADQEQDFLFTRQEEREARLKTTSTIKKYLYEPHVALLKSGAFKLAALRFGLDKLHQHSHLYTSDTFCPDFPGRSFIADETIEFSGKLLKQLGKQIPKANLTTRNFQLTVSELRKRSRIKEGGEVYLFATTLSDERHVLIRCHK